MWILVHNANEPLLVLSQWGAASRAFNVDGFRVYISNLNIPMHRCESSIFQRYTLNQSIHDKTIENWNAISKHNYFRNSMILAYQ